jgi:hypothetical protein
MDVFIKRRSLSLVLFRVYFASITKRNTNKPRHKNKELQRKIFNIS